MEHYKYPLDYLWFMLVFSKRTQNFVKINESSLDLLNVLSFAMTS